MGVSEVLSVNQAADWQRYINPDLTTYRRTCNTRPVHPSLVRAALDLIERDETQARKILAHAHKLDPNLDLDPDTDEIETDAESVINQRLAAQQEN